MPRRLFGAGRGRRGVAAGIAGTLLLSLAVGTAGAPPASAADTVACSPNISVFATDSNGQLWFWRGLANFGAASNGATPIAAGGPVKGTTPDLAHYPKIFGSALAGSTNAMYGISSETGRKGVTYWKNGVPTLITGALYGFVNGGVSRNRITADRSGTIYDIQYGALEMWRYDPATNTWPIWSRTLATGWDAYDLIVADDDGVIWARQTNGDLYRYRVEPGSQRGLTGQKIGYGFQKYKSVFPAGGDTLIGVLPGAGALQAWRYREDNNTWAVNGVALQVPTTTNFSGYTNIWADPRTCSNSVSHAIPAPVVTPESRAPVAVTERNTATGTADGADFALVDDIGRLAVAHQPDRDGTSLPTPSIISGSAAYTGRPQIWQATHTSATDLRQSVLALQRDGHVKRFYQNGTTWTAPDEQGGITPYPPTTVRLGPSWVAAFMTDETGHLFVSDNAWSKETDGSTFIRPNLLSWRDVALPAGVTLAGPVSTAALDSTHAAIVARDTTGALWSAVYTETPLGVSPVSTWKALGGSGLTGTPSVIALPGPVIRVFVRDAAGALVTQLQSGVNGSFPGVWQAVGSAPPATVGNPSAVLGPQDGRSIMFARDSDGAVWRAQERYQACGTFDWDKVLDPNVFHQMVADPTAYVVHTTNGSQWGFVSYDANFSLTLRYESGPDPQVPATPDCGTGSAAAGGGAAARSGTAAGSAGGTAAGTTPAPERPAVTVRTFPPLPKP